jgi:hypothetical protein
MEVVVCNLRLGRENVAETTEHGHVGIFGEVRVVPANEFGAKIVEKLTNRRHIWDAGKADVARHLSLSRLSASAIG